MIAPPGSTRNTLDDSLLVEVEPLPLAQPRGCFSLCRSEPIVYDITVGEQRVLRRYSQFLALFLNLRSSCAAEVPTLPSKLMFHFHWRIRQRSRGLNSWLQQVLAHQTLGMHAAVHDFLVQHTPPADELQFDGRDETGGGAALPGGGVPRFGSVANPDVEIANAITVLKGQGAARIIGGQRHSHALAAFLESDSGRGWLDEVGAFLYDGRPSAIARPGTWRDVLGRLRYMKDLCKLKADGLGLAEARTDLMFVAVVHAAHPHLASLLAALEEGLGEQPTVAEAEARAVMRADAIQLRGIVELAKELAAKILYYRPPDADAPIPPPGATSAAGAEAVSLAVLSPDILQRFADQLRAIDPEWRRPEHPPSATPSSEPRSEPRSEQGETPAVEKGGCVVS